MLSFQNQGVIDTRAITTMGVNAKEGDNPIGHFGTGLKYALAITLRMGGKVTVYRGLERLDFDTVEFELRGKRFSTVRMNGGELGFTTELGKGWQPWMVYRELYCNALDEGGTAAQARLEPREGHTTIHLSGVAEIEEVHGRRSDIMLETRPIWQGDGIEIHRGGSKALYYRGILAGELDRPAAFTYNLVAPMVLTEDRTFKSMFAAIHAIRHAIYHMDDVELLKSWLQAPTDSWENVMDLSYWEEPPSTEWLAVAQEVHNQIEWPANRSLTSLLTKHTQLERHVTQIVLTEQQQVMVDRARRVLAEMGWDVGRHPIKFVDSLGPNILGRATDKTIYIARQAFDMGTKMLAGTLLEEHLHLEYLFADETRDLQNYLINQLMTMAERYVTREPL